MIIRHGGETDLFITQPDHAALAEAIMTAWRRDGFAAHPRRDAILFAIREHDNGWIEEDATTHVDAAGRALDFISVPAEVKHRIWPRAIARVGRDRPHAAALVAQHALTIYASQRPDAAWAPFFDAVEAARASMIARTDAWDEADYRFVRIGDLLSLVFCNGWREPHDLPDGGRVVLTGATLVVRPDPFAGARIPLRVPARRLPPRTYGSAADLRDALERAPVDMLEGWAAGDAGEPTRTGGTV